jgi:hypothetical protein
LRESNCSFVTVTSLQHSKLGSVLQDVSLIVIIFIWRKLMLGAVSNVIKASIRKLSMKPKWNILFT